MAHLYGAGPRGSCRNYVGPTDPLRGSCALLINIAGWEILKPTLFKIIYPIYMEEFKFRVGGFTRKLPVEIANNWFLCRLAIIKTSAIGLLLLVYIARSDTQEPLLFKIVSPFIWQDLGLGFGFSRKNCPLRLPTTGSGGN